MPSDALLKSLHPLEVKVLLCYGQGEPFGAARLEKDLGFKPGQSNQALSWLASKGLAEEVFLKHLKSIFVERGVKTVTVKNAKGKGGKQVLDYTIAQRKSRTTIRRRPC